MVIHFVADLNCIMGMTHNARLGLSLAGLGRIRPRIVLRAIVKCFHHNDCQQIKDNANVVIEGINRMEVAVVADRELWEEIRLMVESLQKLPPTLLGAGVNDLSQGEICNGTF